jgi:hypothetical protein
MEAGDIRFLYKIPSFSPLQIVHRALESLAAPVQNRGVNHGSLHVHVVKKFLKQS